MNTNTHINYRLRKNLPVGTLYNFQVATIIFVLSLSFKLSAAPGIISSMYGSSTLWLYLLFTIVEIAITVLILYFARKCGDSFLMSVNSLSYKICCILCSIIMTSKAIVYFCFCSSYLSHELFGGVEPYLLYIAFLCPIVYLGIKGARTIARCTEILAIIFFGVVLVNLIFLDTDMDFGRNLPVFAIEPKYFFENAPKFSIYLGDCIPFMFVRIRNKRMPYITLGIAISSLIVNIIVMLGVAMYGEALKMATDLFVHIAAFNQLSLEIGRMEWTNLFAMLMMSILSISFLYSGSITAITRATGHSLIAKLLFPMLLSAFAILVPSAREVTNFATDKFGYALLALMALFLLSLIIAFVANKHKYGGLYKCMDEEYLSPFQPIEMPHSIADGILNGQKERAIDIEQSQSNGTLSPMEEQ